MLAKFSNWLYGLKCKYLSKYYAVFPRNLNQKSYHPCNRKLIHSIMEIAQSYLELKYSKKQVPEPVDTEIIDIVYWWENIFLPKSHICYKKLYQSQCQKEIKRTFKKINSLMDDLEYGLHAIIEHIPNMGI